MSNVKLDLNRPPALVQTSGPEQVQAAHWLAVEISGVSYLIPLSHSGEIFPWAKPLPVPYTKSWFLGVVNLRGVLCGVADLSLFMTTSALLNPSERSANSEKCFVGFHASLGINTVLIVDQLLGLKSKGALRPMASTESDSVDFVDDSGRMWREIDMFALAKNAAFVNIAAIH